MHQQPPKYLLGSYLIPELQIRLNPDVTDEKARECKSTTDSLFHFHYPWISKMDTSIFSVFRLLAHSLNCFITVLCCWQIVSAWMPFN